jgi:hypothetical protein
MTGAEWYAERKGERTVGQGSGEPTVQTEFSQVPVESDTTIFHQEIFTVEDYDARWEQWGWNGIKAETLVFIETQLAGMSDNALKGMVQADPRFTTSGPITLTRDNNGYAFVNFNFQY